MFFVNDVNARQGCCSHHGGVCGCRCCDGTSLSAKCAPYYPSCSSNSNSDFLQKLLKKESSEPTIPKKDYTTLATTSAEVIRTVDGDTIEVKFPDGAIKKVRLIGIDTPETVDPRKPVECFGKEASAKMKELVNGKTVTLKRKLNENRDGYGRLLRYVYVGDLFVNAEMIKQGFAYAYTKYPFDAALMEEFRQYEKEARENKLGLWADGICENSDKQSEVLSQNSDSLLGFLLLSFLFLVVLGVWLGKKCLLINQK